MRTKVLIKISKLIISYVFSKSAFYFIFIIQHLVRRFNKNFFKVNTASSELIFKLYVSLISLFKVVILLYLWSLKTQFIRGLKSVCRKIKHS